MIDEKIRQSRHEVAITDLEFVKFREFFYKKTGILFGSNKRYFVDKRISSRIREVGCKTFREYFTMMRFQASGKELQELVNIMTVNETYFFREEHQFKCLSGPILEEVSHYTPVDQVIRIWSMPSSTGEEPYSIALYLLEHWSKIESRDIEIIASDIDSAAISRAKEGVYSARSVKRLPSKILNKYFSKVNGDSYKISDDLRDAINFSKGNLNDPNEMQKFRKFDIIFCRNLLIYFDDISRKRAAEIFYEALNPGGFVLLGHSESMSRISGIFKIRKFPDAIVYQKPR